MAIIFKKLIPDEGQIENLYTLLSRRKHAISHDNLPSKKEHTHFVLNNPYIEWYLIYEEKNLLGSVYIHSDNSIGINIIKPNKYIVESIISYIKKNHKPLDQIKSLRRGEFFLNVATDDFAMIEILDQLSKKKIQSSFVI